MTVMLTILVAAIAIYVGYLTTIISHLEDEVTRAKAGLGHTCTMLKKQMEQIIEDAHNLGAVSSELREWNKDLVDHMMKMMDSIEDTDRRCREIERYYVTYVARRDEGDE